MGYTEEEDMIRKMATITIMLLAAPLALAVPAQAATHANCSFSDPAYDFNANISGSTPPPWGADWWPTGATTCGLWINAVADFNTGGTVYGPHRTSINDISKATGPLNDFLTRLYEQVGVVNGTGRCIRRVYHTANAWSCTASAPAWLRAALR